MTLSQQSKSNAKNLASKAAEWFDRYKLASIKHATSKGASWGDLSTKSLFNKVIFSVFFQHSPHVDGGGGLIQHKIRNKSQDIGAWRIRSTIAGGNFREVHDWIRSNAGKLHTEHRLEKLNGRKKINNSKTKMYTSRRYLRVVSLKELSRSGRRRSKTPWRIQHVGPKHSLWFRSSVNLSSQLLVSGVCFKFRIRLNF